MAHPKLWDDLYRIFLVNKDNNNLDSPKRVLAYPWSQNYIHPPRESKYIIRLENSAAKPSFLEIEVHS
jgi:hypothetical protein